MTEASDKVGSRIGGMLKNDASHRIVARRLFLFEFAEAFMGNEERGFGIFNEVRDWFKVPFSAIKLAGSAQLGYSYIKKRDFVPEVSDLDIAIISPNLFQKYSELVYWTTKRYSDQTGFPVVKGSNAARDYRFALSNGIFRPDLMPRSQQKTEWFAFFSKLSDKHLDLFKGINAGIYLSEGFFEMKNASVVDEFRKATQ